MLTYYNNIVANNISPQPNEQYRNDMQAFIDEQWDNTTAMYTVQEQKNIGSDVYDCIEVWINYVVGQSSTGLKNGDDFRQLTFKDITHPCIRGRYYKFDDNIWITYFTDEYDSVTKTLTIRRCNNFLRWVNPDNGNIETVPCVIDYDMSSPSMQVTQQILTPNNHATIMVQGNDLTINQLKTNMRFILANRPFKLYGYQNTIMDDLSTPEATLLYLDLYLDEIQANDDMANKIAFNGRYDYTIVPNQLSIDGVKDSTGQITVQTLLNNEPVDRPLTWTSENNDIITVDKNGNYTILGNAGETTKITVQLTGNPKSIVYIPVKVVAIANTDLDVAIEPYIEKIRQFEDIDFVVSARKFGTDYSDFQSVVSLSDTDRVLSNKYLTIKPNGLNQYNLSCSAFGPVLQNLYVTATDNLTGDKFTIMIPIKTVNMFG